MNTTGSNLQQVQHAAGQKPVAKDSAAETFAAPPPLLQQKRSNVKRSYMSLIAMSPLESLLPPSSGAPSQSDYVLRVPQSQNIEAALYSKMTPSPVVDEVITDSKAVADLCTVLNADEGVLLTNPDAPSLARSTLYTERCVTAKDVIGAIDSYWALEQLPSVEIFTEDRQLKE